MCKLFERIIMFDSNSLIEKLEKPEPKIEESKIEEIEIEEQVVVRWSAHTAFPAGGPAQEGSVSPSRTGTTTPTWPSDIPANDATY